MPEVINRVRQEMGEDAIILHTQQKRGLLWWLRRTPTVRVWAAIATNSRTNGDSKARIDKEMMETSTLKKSEPASPSLAPVTSAPSSPTFFEPNENRLMSSAATDEVTEPSKSRRKRARKKQEASQAGIDEPSIRRRQRSSNRKKVVSDEFLELAQRVENQLQLLAASLWGQETVISQTGVLGALWKCGVDLQTIQKLFSSQPPTPDPHVPIKQWLNSVLKRHLPVTGGLSPKTSVAVLVGPTGVGKTTTVAKIASNQLIQHRRRVSLITVDVFRIGAVQQLETYARLMGLPFFVAVTPEEAQKCVQQAKQVSNLVLVDTIGRSPKHSDQLEALWELVAAMNPDEVLLTLPANGNPADLSLAAERFSIFCPTSLIITKLDEATQTGIIANLVTRLNLPVAYITTGQNVPEDLEVPTSERLAEWVLLPLGGQREVYKSVSGEVRSDA